jgi:hypothetical protein
MFGTTIMFHIAFSLSETMPRTCRVVDMSIDMTERIVNEDCHKTSLYKCLVLPSTSIGVLGGKIKPGGKNYAFVQY